MPYEVKLTIFILLAIFVFGGILFWFLFPLIRRKLFSSRYKRFYYDYVNHVVKYNDFYLINNLAFDVGDAQTLSIDHLIGGDKYIYVIIDYYVDGGIKIDPLQPISYVYKKDDKKFEIANHLQVVAHSMTKLSSLSGISSEFLVGIVLINDDCNVVSIENGSSPVNIVRLRELSKFIGEYEKRPVKPFVSRQLWQAIQDLHTIKENVQSRKKQ